MTLYFLRGSSAVSHTFSPLYIWEVHGFGIREVEFAKPGLISRALVAGHRRLVFFDEVVGPYISKLSKRCVRVCIWVAEFRKKLLRWWLIWVRLLVFSTRVFQIFFIRTLNTSFGQKCVGSIWSWNLISIRIDQSHSEIGNNFVLRCPGDSLKVSLAIGSLSRLQQGPIVQS